MGLLSEKNKEVLLGPLSANNPVVVQMLGICSALAVTSKLEPAIVMGISVTAVVAFTNDCHQSGNYHQLHDNTDTVRNRITHQ